jgi:hypothetical protein
MSRITVHVRLLSGDVLPVTMRARNGQVKFKTARPTLENAVLEHVERKDCHVKFVHEDDEERRLAIRREVTNAGYRRRFQRDASEAEHALTESSQMDISFVLSIQDKLEKSRVYHDGDMVTVLVEQAPHWSDLEDSESDFE